ncbi:MAG: glycosyltransferase family 4 protein, partial [Kangiellaceae bacterium]|nr:glycosyltransferase family 4 protein [Kangiellaceae bacterium]
IATGKFALWNVALSSLFFRKKTIAIIHGTEVNLKHKLQKKMVDLALRTFESIIAVSEYTKDFVSDLNRKVMVIPNGIDLSIWKNSDFDKLELLSLVNSYPRLTTVGRLSKRKGQLNVIRHLPKLLKSFPNLHYHCIGLANEIDMFLSVAKELEVEANLSFHGPLDHKALCQILAETDVFLMLSSEDDNGDVEGFGIAILEANAMGVPVIGSVGCGIKEAISSNYSGRLINPSSFEEFHLALNDILHSRMEYSERAKKWAKKHSWEKIIKQYLKVIIG